MTEQLPTPNPMKLIGHVSRAFMRVTDVEMRTLGMAVSQMPVLMALKGGHALSQAELARLARVEQPSMAQLLNRMERDGLVERVPDPADKRSRLISLTPFSARRMAKARSLMEARVGRALDGFTEREVSQLTALLLRLIANLDQMEEA